MRAIRRSNSCGALSHRTIWRRSCKRQGCATRVAIEAARGVGPERLMLGSDWPVANLRRGYGKVWRETMRALAGLSREECDRILGGTAIAFYRLPGLC